VGSTATLFASIVVGGASGQKSAARITILFDAFGVPSDLKRGWGYAAFIEYDGRRVLFDTGSKSADFAYNASALKVDLKRLDFVVLTHRHDDHTAGLNHVLRENPSVKVYTPIEGGQFDSPIPAGLVNLINRAVPSVPDDLRYFGENMPADSRPEPPWTGAHFAQINEPTEVFPGLFLFSTRSETLGTREMNEISLVAKTPKGAVLVVGCSHPGIEKILEVAVKIDSKIHAVFGGFHLVNFSDVQVTEMVTRLRDKWGIERMAAGHCTGQFAFAEMARIYGTNFDHAGVGSVIGLPT
jgi:7,8-dihydropterin-6-yl-methyl-4-(beta-D-ribofuranosyl)aminobenzene 5'-phosphate synthase